LGWRREIDVACVRGAGSQPVAVVVVGGRTAAGVGARSVRLRLL